MSLTTDDTTEQHQCISDDDGEVTVDTDPVSRDKVVDGGTEPPQTAAPGDDTPAADQEESSDVRQRAMYARFRSWTLRNYGETGKTKTVTRTKYERVVAILSGAEPPTADNSKLRFWIKAKGFRLGYPVDTDPPTIVNRNELYIPSKTWVRVINIR